MQIDDKRLFRVQFELEDGTVWDLTGEGADWDNLLPARDVPGSLFCGIWAATKRALEFVESSEEEIRDKIEMKRINPNEIKAVRIERNMR